jgi:hypothetical protein
MLDDMLKVLTTEFGKLEITKKQLYKFVESSSNTPIYNLLRGISLRRWMETDLFSRATVYSYMK